MWIRQAAIDGIGRSVVTETWRSPEGASFEVDVKVGKALDVLALKGTDLKEIAEYARFLKESGARVYGSGSDLNELRHCPCCARSTDSAAAALSVYNASYLQCSGCGHVFVGHQANIRAHDELLSDSDEHASTYTDPAAIEVRLAQVVAPKLTWVQDVYRRHVGNASQVIVDVGAGGGHFVEASRRGGLTAFGFELSRASRRFAKDNFSLDLIAKDFLSSPLHCEADVVTFWGLLEYTPAPKQFLEKARQYLMQRNGLLVVEVPRYDCVSTAIQRQFPDTIARHMDPTSHVNCFTDASVMAALQATGFAPVAAWYFGMDAYELLIQFALREGPQILERYSHLISGLQASFDSSRLCDDLIVAAVPR